MKLNNLMTIGFTILILSFFPALSGTSDHISQLPRIGIVLGATCIIIGIMASYIRLQNEKMEFEIEISGNKYEVQKAVFDLTHNISIERDNLKTALAKLLRETQDFHNHCIDMGWVDIDDDSAGIKRLNLAKDVATLLTKDC